ncbi:tetratricopeptide repeat protein [Endozoicomonas sp.]|uniref:tetratricopeptide repeat protein n=1 Tax=Endozoicomonas sp. TaxID=1892382 RepID=UPI0028855E77|nr:tetratricopeptide repeat protein [Endozoicomonas sp.]
MRLIDHLLHPGRRYLLLVLALLLSGCQGLQKNTQSQAASADTPVAGLYQGELTAEMLGIEENLTLEQALLKGDRSWSQGETDRAAAYYVQAIELAKQNNLDENATTTEDSPGTVNKSTDAHSQHQGYVASLKLARLYQQKGQKQLAERIYQQLVESYPHPVAALEALGLTRLKQRQTQQAGKLLNKAVTSWRQMTDNKDYQPAQALNGLGILADLSEDFQAAESFYQEALTLSPSDPAIINNMGYSLYLAGHWNRAKSHFRQALNIQPDYPQATRNLSLLYIRQNKPEEAITLLKSTMEPWEALNDVGYISLLAGYPEAAEQLFEQALDQSPSHYNLAWKNLEMARQALLTPDPVENRKPNEIEL